MQGMQGRASVTDTPTTIQWQLVCTQDDKYMHACMDVSTYVCYVLRCFGSDVLMCATSII